MTEDPRCCGSGTCIIDAAGRCWCGQQWDGDKMCFAPLDSGTHKNDANSPELDRPLSPDDRASN
jgi:hypothetical protein